MFWKSIHSNCRGSEYMTPKYATLAFGLFWTEGSQHSELRWGGCSEWELIPEVTYIWMSYLEGRTNIWLPNTCSFNALWMPYSHPKPQAPVPYLSSEWHANFNWPHLPFDLMFLWDSCTNFFSAVNLSYVILIFRPAKEPRIVEGKYFFSPQQNSILKN